VRGAGEGCEGITEVPRDAGSSPLFEGYFYINSRRNVDAPTLFHPLRKIEKEEERGA
jgi:hypothetical protein